MATLTVGAGKEYATLAAAIADSHDGDVIQVAAGTYTNDFATINTKITIEGVGGMVRMEATVPPPDDKAILTINTDVTICNMEFFGAAVAEDKGGNGAGIRYQGGNLVLDHTYFHDNQNGLLSAPDPAGTITIRNSEFAHNGGGQGNTHNLYVGVIDTLTISNSYFHDAVVGHEIKSRALNNLIEDNRIGNGPDGNGSYTIDLTNGGNATIRDNVIEKGPNAENHVIITFGEEGVYPGSTLSVTGNTVLNDNPATSFLVRDSTGGTVSVTGNHIYGLNESQLYTGAAAATVSNNDFLTQEPAFDTSHPYEPPLVFEFAVCFAEGTRILTASGEIAIERLKPGDRIVTLVNGGHVLQPVKWVGYRRIDLTAHPRPEFMTPVRIVRGAIEDNVPHRDLLVSPDHALYFDGVLIIARQLINGMTIGQDTVRAVNYFHVELDAHAILFAEGLAAESYLDTGNRGFFANSDVPLILHPGGTAEGVVRRRENSCIPPRDDEPTVWPVWRRLADRAVKLGYADAAPATTADPELRLLVRNRVVRAASVASGRHAFMLPADVAEVRLLSRAAAPTDCRPWLEDRRRLGVSVGGIVLRGNRTVGDIPLDHPGLSDGWWAVERAGNALTRWTNGDAALRLPRMSGPGVLEIRLAARMTYPLPVADEVRERRREGTP